MDETVLYGRDWLLRGRPSEMVALSRLFQADIKAFTHIYLVWFSLAVLDDIDSVWLPPLIVLLYEVVVAFVFGWTYGLGCEHSCTVLVWLPPAIAEQRIIEENRDNFTSVQQA